MAKGVHPAAYFKNPHIDKPQEAVYADLDSFTDEVFADNVDRWPQISMFTLLPPLAYDGRFIKGILATQAADLLLDRHPYLQDLFYVAAYAMWSGVPHCTRADGIMMCYDNPHREAWFKAQNPARAQQVWIPHDDTDLFDDQDMAPKPVKKDIDVLCVARLDAIKNLQILAEAVKIMHLKHPGRTFRMVLNTGEGVDLNWTRLHVNERNELKKINAVLINTPDYLYIEPERQPKLSNLYNRAKCVVMCALCEGKNRSIHEAMSCNVPVVTFKHFNQYARHGVLPFPSAAGLLAPEFTAESLADTLLRVLDGPQGFTPRQSVLQISGRRKVLSACLDAFPYYARNLPGFTPGQHLLNPWIDLAMQIIFQRNIHQHLYGFGRAEGQPAVWHKGLEEIERILGRYAGMVKLKAVCKPEV